MDDCLAAVVVGCWQSRRSTDHLEGASGVPEVAEKRDAARRTLRRLLVHAIKRLPQPQNTHAVVVIKSAVYCTGMTREPPQRRVEDLKAGDQKKKTCCACRCSACFQRAFVGERINSSDLSGVFCSASYYSSCHTQCGTYTINETCALRQRSTVCIDKTITCVPPR